MSTKEKAILINLLIFLLMSIVISISVTVDMLSSNIEIESIAGGLFIAWFCVVIFSLTQIKDK